MATIPPFDTLDEAVEFWETHDSAVYWDDLEEVAFEPDLHPNLLHPDTICAAFHQAEQRLHTEYAVV